MWAFLFTLSFHLGSWLASHLASPAFYWPRTPIHYLIVCLPAFLRFPRNSRQVVFLHGVLVLLGTVQGLVTIREIAGRVELEIPAPWEPSRYGEFQTPALFRLTSWPEDRPEGHWKAAARIVGIPVLGETGPVAGQGVLLDGQGPVPRPGDLYRAKARFRVPAAGDLPGMFSERLFLAGRDLQWKAREQQGGTIAPDHAWWRPWRDTLADLREDLSRRLRDLLPGPEGELAGAILLGRRTAASREAARPFGQLGLAHLFAVSGLHVGVLLGLVLLPAQWLGFPPGLRWAMMALLLPPYALLTGLPGSVVRAAGLALLVTLGPVVGRRVDSLHALGLLFWANIIWQPGQVMDTGVLLSYGAVGSILLWIRVRGPALAFAGRRGRTVNELLQVGLAAQWGTLPAVAASFGQVSLYSPLANLLAIPLFSLAVWATVLGLILPAGLGSGLATWAWVIWRGLAAGVGRIQELVGHGGLGLPSPGPATILSWVLLTLMTGILLARGQTGKSPLRAIPCALVALGIGVGAFSHGPRILGRLDGPQVLQFDVGQGDAALVRFPDGWSAWIDTGGCWQGRDGRLRSPMQRDLLPWLARRGQGNCAAILLSHGHRDHTGGCPALRAAHPDAVVYGAGRARPDTSRSGFLPGLVHRWGDWTLEILYPSGVLPPGFSENDHSMVVVLRRGTAARYLWTGDLEARGENLLLAQGLAAPVQVWKAGHHGSHTSGTAPFLARIRPGLVVISCGPANRYGHPSHGPYVAAGDTLDLLRSDRDGSLEFAWNRAGEGRWRNRGGPWHRLP